MKPLHGPATNPHPHFTDNGGVELSARETEIVRQIADGKSSKEIAVALGVSLKTIESHRIRLFRKLGFPSVVDLVRYAIRNGLIEP